MEIPEQYKKAFKKVYSDNKGQHKVTAYETLKQSGFLPPNAEINLGAKIGGGAMFTTYPFQITNPDTQSKTFGIIKIMNPNIEGQMKTALKVLRQLFFKLTQEDPQKYRGMEQALIDIEQWVMKDLDLESGFIHGQRFIEENKGLTSTSGKYQIDLPNTLHVDTKFVIEEFVEGKTFQYLSSKDLARKSEIVDLLRSSFTTQVLNGLTHSDIHPGNVIVSPSGKVYWIDKTMLLTLSDQEKDALIEFSMTPSISKLLEILLRFDQNSSLNPELITNLTSTAATFDQNILNGQDPTETLKEALIHFRQHNLTVPFNIIMSFKNYLGLQKL